MKKNLIITGDPGAGKTTLVEFVLEKIRTRAGGFFTREIRERGERKGFTVVTLDGQEATLAHVDFADQPRVGKYGVDVSVVDRVVVPVVERAILEKDIVIIDEIASMELLSEKFCEVVTRAFDSPRTVLATMHAFAHPFTDSLRKRPDVTIVHLTVANRDQQLLQIEDILGVRKREKE